MAANETLDAQIARLEEHGERLDAIIGRIDSALTVLEEARQFALADGNRTVAEYGELRRSDPAPRLTADRVSGWNR